MKKIISLLVWCIVVLTTATAQINSYSFAYTAGTYSEISGGTVVYSGAAQGAEPLCLENYAFVPGDTLISEIATVTGYPIGFNFNLGEQTFTHFAISPNGFIYLGGDAPFEVAATSVSTVMVDDSRFEEGAINVLGFSRTSTCNTAGANTEISYLLSGDAGSQILTVQFKKIIFSWSSTTDAVDIQIRLYEADSKVEMIFNDLVIPQYEFAWAEIGLKGNVVGNTKFLNIGAGDNWSTATAGVTGNVSLRNSTCDNGATFTFTPPPACVTPASQPTDLQLTASSNGVSGSFTATADADKYLVLMGKDISMVGLKDRPVDGVTYNVGDVINNKLTVVTFSPNITFSVDNLENSSEYSFYIYAANAECLYGSPKYNPLKALNEVIKTLPGAPQLLSLSEGGFTGLKLAVQANAANNPVIVAVNSGQWAVDNNQNQLNDGVFGTPTLNMNTGDQLTGGGKIIYKGPASDAIEVTGLEPNKLVNFAAWSYDETDNAISSALVKLNVTIWGTLPYSLDFSQYKAYDIPEGWEEEGGYFRLEQDNTTRRGSYLSCNRLPASETGSYASITTQYLKLAPGESRLSLAGRLFQTSSARPFPENDLTEWNEKDSLLVQVIKYGTTEPITVYTVNAANAFGGNFNVKLPITGFANDTVKVKLAWRVHSTGKTNSLQITKYIIEEKPEQESPVNLTVDLASIVGNQAKVTWEKHATGTESAWEVRYRLINTETWSTPVETSETNYLFTTLPTDATVEVAVRAVVGLNIYSAWSDPISFKTGYGLPYNEEFTGYTAANFAANSRWTIIAPSSTSLIVWSSSKLLFMPNADPVTEAFALLPKLDFGDGSTKYKLAFDLSVSGTVPDSDSIYVIDKTAEE
ncbi:MAG: fibronectin type III domain-containing protein, partial [Dysgonamonadaceae bacterium]|nr:fibronectin type III domain-containing protein [Dysgonamonadaceae bacterium]